MIGQRKELLKKWEPVDRVVISYTVLTSLLVILQWEMIQYAPRILALKIVIFGVLCALPARGAVWEFSSAGEGVLLSNFRRFASLLRYAYPLVLVLVFFEEVEYTVNALYPGQPYWFEAVLIRAERAIFGGLPVLQLSVWTHPLLNEFMFAAYFSYFIILIGGVTITWFRLRKAQEAFRRGEISREEESFQGRGFSLAITGMSLAYFSTFLFFPLLPARGPWEHPVLMEGLPSLDGYLFAYLIAVVIHHGAVSGGCFPSSHVSGTWGLITSTPRHFSGFRRFAFTAVILMSFACVYTRYHWALDVLVGLPIGLLASIAAKRLVLR